MQTQQSKQAPTLPDGLVRATFYAKAADTIEPETASRTIDVVASTDLRDRCGRVVLQDWNLATYLQNPVVLWNHGEGAGWDSDDTELTIPIGFATNVRVEENQLRATLNFVDAKASPLAEKVYQGMRQGSIRAVSVGWLAHTVRYEIHDDVEVLVCANNELLEISPCAIPANPGAGAESARFFASLRSAATHPENAHMKKLAAALGLKATATEDEIAAAVEKITTAGNDLTTACNDLKTLLAPAGDDEEAPAGESEATANARRVKRATSLLREVATAVGAAKPSEITAAVVGMKASVEAGAAASARLALLEGEKQTTEVASLLKQGRDEGKLTDANTASFLRICGATDDAGTGVDAGKLRALVANLPKVVNQTAAKTPPVTGAGSQLTDREKRLAKNAGLTDEEFLAQKNKKSGSSAAGGN